MSQLNEYSLQLQFVTYSCKVVIFCIRLKLHDLREAIRFAARAGVEVVGLRSAEVAVRILAVVELSLAAEAPSIDEIYRCHIDATEGHR
jgi:hypothetical protein